MEGANNNSNVVTCIFSYFSVTKSSGDGFTSMMFYPVKVKNDGSVFWMYSSIVESNCDINMALFPFDTQNCLIAYGCLTSDVDEISLQNESWYVKSDFLIESGEFLVAFNSVSAHEFADLQGDDFAVLYIRLQLQRRPNFYLINMILPCTVLSLLSVFAFCLPVTGDRVSLQITLLVSFVIYQLMLSDYIPVTSVNIPVLSKYSHKPNDFALNAYRKTRRQYQREHLVVKWVHKL